MDSHFQPALRGSVECRIAFVTISLTRSADTGLYFIADIVAKGLTSLIKVRTTFTVT